MMREETVALGALRLDCGETLANVQQRVTTYGTRRGDGSNVVLVEHALTGSSRAAEWWQGVVGDGGLFDPADWFVVGVNALGSCYGSSGPTTLDNFPRVTVRDIVRAEIRALDALGIERIAVVIGGSLGGMRALQWAVEAPERVRACVMIGAHDHHSAMGVALNALQREAIALDAARGIRLARKIAMLTYKSEELLKERHDRRPDRKGRPLFDVEGYLERQADVFEARMDGASYAALTHAMDSFDVRGLLRAKTPKLIFAGISSDWLFRPQDVRAAASRCVLAGCDAQCLELRTGHGHDAFLAEPAALRALLEPVIAAALEPARC
ncbi:MAG TPA: alpha/beta fold hydrolase [Candidatus Binatia bacterium]|nr:alpha/beta fold hydrolase [Candidatus Binatia bacterium]